MSHIPTDYTADDFAFARSILADPATSPAWRSGAVQILLHSRLHDDIELASRAIAARRKTRPARWTATYWLVILAAVLAAVLVGHQLGRLAMEIWLGLGQVLDQASSMRGM